MLKYPFRVGLDGVSRRTGGTGVGANWMLWAPVELSFRELEEREAAETPLAMRRAGWPPLNLRMPDEAVLVLVRVLGGITLLRVAPFSKNEKVPWGERIFGDCVEALSEGGPWRASRSEGSRMDRSIATGRPRCRPRIMTAQRISFDSVRKSPQSE